MARLKLGDSILQIPTQNFWLNRIDEHGTQHKIRAIVLHITDSTSQSAINWFLNPNSNASAHYLVTENAEIIQMVDEKDAAWHAGKVVNPRWLSHGGANPNYSTIGIEVASKGQFPPIKQWFDWARLCKDIMNRNNLTLDAFQVVNHNEIHGGKVCPGYWFSRYWLSFLIKLV